MPRAFLIKKKQSARSGSPSSRGKKQWFDPDSDVENVEVEEVDAELHGASQQSSLAEHTSGDAKGPYDLSMKARTTPTDTMTSSYYGLSQNPPSPPYHRQVSTSMVLAPKPIKPVPKTVEEINSLKHSWNRRPGYHPYLPYNHPGYPPKMEMYLSGSNGLVMSYQGLVPPPLVPLSTSSNQSNRDVYPSPRDRYTAYEHPGHSPPIVNSPSPPTVYSGWVSDSQDSGLASSPSPSSEDSSDQNPQRPAQIANQTRYQCPDCNKSYSTYSGLSKHCLMHCSTQAAKSFSCKYCDKVYVSLGALKMHIRTHTLPCKCKLCGKAFSRPWLLQGHIRTHTGEKPFSCPHCSRAFADRSNLRAHLQTHSEVKKYRCKTCSKTFSRMSLLLKHEDGGCSGVAPPQ